MNTMFCKDFGLLSDKIIILLFNLFKIQTENNKSQKNEILTSYSKYL